MNLEFHSNRISSKFRIRIESNTNIQSSVASNSIRILNGVEMSCWDAASSTHKSVPESAALWPYASIFLFNFCPNHENNFLQPPKLSSHILYTHTHTRLQNKIIYIPVKNKI